ncbi:hypothetical protein A2U01_0113572, partial [Trifolium medium]|nr:hypothetical protein [Trifolium medium]
MLSQPQDQDGRIFSEDGDEDDEEEERRLLATAKDLDGESEGEGENLLPLNSLVNANNSP